jgi:preprotein translocase subunit SecF
MAAYTFTTLTVAIINVIKYRKYDSPIYSASKAISLAAASVSIITLESTMLTTFGGETMDDFTQKLMLGLTGGAIAAFIIGMAIYMIYQSTKRLKLMNNKDGTNGK